MWESNAPTPIMKTSDVTKRKPSRPLPVYVRKAKTIASSDAVVPVAAGPFSVPVFASASKCSSSIDFTTQVAPTTTEAASETAPSRVRDTATQTEVSKKRRLLRVQKTYQVGGQTVLELHEEEEWF